ncbi:MAG: PD40 domain-containing protein [Flavobacteriales bacterium]|nr:PD40 domain-containing protein [Flavobacteriales bacterium]MCB9185691.1 PD40 domain-containing protein [Flavobacteriales bacterium]
MRPTIKLLATALFLLSVHIAAEAQILSGPDKIKMMQAKTNFNDGDYNGALRVYRAEYTDHGTDAMLNFRMGECYLALNQGQDALAYFQKAEKYDANIDKELHYNLAESFRLVSYQKKAIEELDKYLANDKLAKADIDKANALKHKCEVTLEMMANPVDVKITSAGDGINTDDNHEYHPTVTADGKLMVFTSRRPDTQGGQRYEGDNDWYEDVYISYWSDSLKGWAPAVPIPGAINTEGHDANLSISPDGRELFTFQNKNAGDIFVSKTRMNKGASDAIADGSPDAARLMSLNRWSKAYSLGKNVNSGYFDSNASVTADGKTIYFISERPMGGKGNGDIWTASAVSSTTWEKASNLEALNTIEDEKSVFVAADGKTIFFSSKGHDNLGGYDIFKSVMQEDGTWSKPENLGYPINTPGDEVDFTITADGKTAYYSTKGSANGKFDIMRIDLSNYPLLGK